MKRRNWKFAGIISVFLLLSPNAIAESELMLEKGEEILSERILSDDKAEIFLEKDGEEYFRVYAIEGENWILESEEKIDNRKKGLSGEEKLSKNPEFEVLVKNYLDSNEYDGELMPSKLDYSSSEYLPPVGEQQENSCVGWAVGYYLRTFQIGKELGWEISKDGQAVSSRVFSPNFVYNQINGGEDNGATLQDAGRLLKNVGAATLEDFPYNPGDYQTKPTYDIVREGYKYRIEDSHTLFSRQDSDESKILSLKEYLLTGDLPIVGVDAGYSWEVPHEDENGNFIVTKDDSYIGGHAVVVVGYDDELETPDGVGAFKVLNSWGTEWGKDGYAYVSYEAMAEDTINGIVYTDLERFYVENEHESYMNGYEDGSFQPDKLLTRAEAAKILVSVSGEEILSGESFEDVKGHWAADEIYTAYQKGYVLGDENSEFHPNDEITRAEFAIMIYRKMGQSIPKSGDYIITKYFYDSIEHWSSRQVNTLGSMRVIGGYPDGSFQPEKQLTRAEAVTILNRIEERIPEKEFISQLSQPYTDLIKSGKKHWAYSEIMEASKSHMFEYNLNETGDLNEKWQKAD